MNLTKNQSKILLKLIDMDGCYRKEIEKSLKMNLKSFHDSLVRLILNEAVRSEVIKAKGNPHKIYLTDYGKVLLDSIKRVDNYAKKYT